MNQRSKITTPIIAVPMNASLLIRQLHWNGFINYNLKPRNMKNNVKLLAAIAVLTSSMPSQSQVIELSLQETIALSEKGNRQIQNSRLEASKSEEYTKEMRSYLKPTVSAAGSYTFFVERPVIFLREEASGKETINAIQIGGRNAFA